MTIIQKIIEKVRKDVIVYSKLHLYGGEGIGMEIISSLVIRCMVLLLNHSYYRSSFTHCISVKLCL